MPKATKHGGPSGHDADVIREVLVAAEPGEDDAPPPVKRKPGRPRKVVVTEPETVTDDDAE
jgi:hypothetical protein